MDDGRHTPFAEEFRAREEEDGGPSPASNTPEEGLTHRPRAQQRLDPDALDSAMRGSSHGGRSSHARERKRKEKDASAAETPDLRPFADQLIAIAQQLRTGEFGLAPLSFDEANPKSDALSIGQAPSNTAFRETDKEEPAHELEALDLDQRRKAFAHMARTAYAKRRKRTSIFGDPELFGEPGWDILLDLYIAQVEQKPVSVSSACIGSASPPTTGLRWLGVLTEQGLIAREHDPLDQRRVLVRLTDKALEAMDAYFSSSANLNGDRRAARA